jgi:hypothetical protein
MRGDEQTASIVILESGASWPRLAHELQRRATHAIVESQPSSESPSAFVERVLARLAKLQAEGVVLTLAVIAVSDRLDEAADLARQRMARAIARAMTGSEGELTFSAPEHVDDDVRHHLFSLAGCLIDELGGAPVGVGVRFSSISDSAIRAVRPSDPDFVADTA